MAFIGTRRNGLSFLCRSKKHVSKQFTHSLSTHSAMEDDNAYLVGLRLTFFLTVLLGLHFLPGMIIFLLLCMIGVFWLLFLLGSG